MSPTNITKRLIITIYRLSIYLKERKEEEKKKKKKKRKERQEKGGK